MGGGVGGWVVVGSTNYRVNLQVQTWDLRKTLRIYWPFVHLELTWTRSGPRAWQKGFFLPTSDHMKPTQINQKTVYLSCGYVLKELKILDSQGVSVEKYFCNCKAASCYLSDWLIISCLITDFFEFETFFTSSKINTRLNLTVFILSGGKLNNLCQ